jgi:hypothetical protein
MTIQSNKSFKAAKPTKLKLDIATLYKFALSKMKTTAEKFKADTQRKISLSSAKYIRTDRIFFSKICPITNQPYYRDELIYETANYFIRTTVHGKIIDIETKPRSVFKPQVVVKVRRTFNRNTK